MARQVALIMALVVLLVSGNVYAATSVITPTTTAGGTISPSTKQMVETGSSKPFVLTALEGYYLSEYKIDGVKPPSLILSDSDRKSLQYVFTTTKPTHSIAAKFTANPVITATTNAGGTISGLGKLPVLYNSNNDYTATAFKGFYLSEFKVNGTKLDIADDERFEMTRTLLAVTSNSSIAAKFTANPVITATTNAGGKIFASGDELPAAKTTVVYNNSQSYSIVADEGYHLVDVKVDGKSQGAITEYTFPPVTTKHTISAKFLINSYDITTSAGKGGKISPAKVTAKYNTSKVFTVTPNKGYHVVSVTVNGVEQLSTPATGVYKLNIASVTEKLAISASFASDGLVSGLPLASQMSVVDAQGGAGTSSPAMFKGLARLAALANPVPDNSDYNKDVTNVYVNEKSGEAFKTVNMVLCMVAQTKYSDSSLVNHGPYIAMVNSNICRNNDSADNSGSSASAGTSATAAPSYDLWTIISERADDALATPHILSFYIHMKDGGGSNNEPMSVQAKMTITEGVSDTNPLGVFSMTYRGYPTANPLATTMKGVLKAEKVDGKVVIKIAEEETTADATLRGSSRAAYSRDSVAKTGSGSAEIIDNYGGSPEPLITNINFGYDSANFLRENADGSDQVCLDRTKYETSAWRYGMYDSTTGNRINVNGGFSINTQADGKGAYGYLGYYGLNLPPGISLVNGMPIYKTTWDNGVQSVTPYSLFVRGGKLKKHTRSEITLADIKNIPLEGFIPPPGGIGGQSSEMQRLTWDGINLAIRATAAQNPKGPPVWSASNNPDVIQQSRIMPYSSIGLYSQALGGQINIQLAGCIPVDNQNPMMGVNCTTPDATTTVILYKEATINTNDTVPGTLTCYDNCPIVDATGITGTYPASNTQHAYSFNDMLLKVGSNNATLNTASVSQPWGFSSGPLFEATQTNLGMIACDWNALQTCSWKAWNALPEFYTWETGPNSWNQYTTVIDTNDAPVVFDPPLQVSYTHQQSDVTANDYKYNGTNFFLQYSGFGDLQGIPGRCVNPNDPTAMVLDCSQPGMRWVPEFMIPADSTVQVGNDTNIVKPLDVEQRMAKAVDGACSSITPTDMSASLLSVATDWVNPALPTEPVITDPPRVIGGVIQ